MAITIGPKGFVNLVSSDDGARRKVKIVSFKGLAAAGDILGTQFYPAASKRFLAAVIDVTAGLNSTTYFRDTGSVAGDLHLNQVDTGTTANFTNHTMWAIYTDTGSGPI